MKDQNRSANIGVKCQLRPETYFNIYEQRFTCTNFVLASQF